MKFPASTVLFFVVVCFQQQRHQQQYTLGYTPSFVQQRAKIGLSSFVSRKKSTTTQRPIELYSAAVALDHASVSSSSSSSGRSTTSGSSSNGNNGNMMTMLVETSGGMEELIELTEKIESPVLLSKQVRKSPGMFKLASIASIPVSAALGFVGLVPVRQLAVQTVGAFVTGIAGVVGKSRLDALAEANAKPALAQALIDYGFSNIKQTQAAILNVKEQFGISDEDFALICTEIYSSYLIGMVKYMPTAKTSELKELDNMKQVLQLDNLQIGEAHYLAAKEWYRTISMTTSDDELMNNRNHPDRKSIDKLLFLTERALRQANETDEAFVFEMTRVAKAFQIQYPTALERISETAQPFYERALKSTRSKLDTDQVSYDMLERARMTLGLSESIAKDMKIACFHAEVRERLGLPPKSIKTDTDDDDDTDVDDDDDDDDEEEEVDDIDMSTLRFTDEDAERLEKLQSILGLSNTDVDYEIALVVTPLYQKTALNVLNDVIVQTRSPKDAWDVLETKREDLLLNENNCKTILTSIIMQALGTPIERTNTFAKVNNEIATYEQLVMAIETKQAIVSILEQSLSTNVDDDNDDTSTNTNEWKNEIEHFDEIFCNPWNKQSANGFLSTEERTKMYKIFVSRSVRKTNNSGKSSSSSNDDSTSSISTDVMLSDDNYQRMKQVQGLLGITDQQAELEIRRTLGPKLQTVLREAMNEMINDYTPELAKNMQNKITTIMSNLHLSNDYLRESSISLYAKAVDMVRNSSPGGIPTKELFVALDALRELYQLTKEESYPSHYECFGTIYKKSILEAMGSTGIIRSEFVESLDNLRERFGISTINAQTLFLEAIEEKMKPLVQWIGSELERTMLNQKQLSQRRKKDMGEDVFQTGKGADGVLGLGAEVNLLSDIMELVDFYLENKVVQEVDDEAESSSSSAAEEEDGNETTTSTKTNKIYPITALGSTMIDQEIAELLYRQLLVGSFTTQGPNAVRYENARDTFAGILGLSSQTIDDIHNTIGTTVYDNFVSNAMKTKGTLDQQDYMFLASIQSKLGLSEEEGERLLVQSQKKLLLEEINTIMEQQQSAPTPESLKLFREKCNSMGMDLYNDVGISKQRLVRMFEYEIVPMLKDGRITVDTSTILAEIQDSLGLDANECEIIFEKVLLQLSTNCISIIKGELMRGRVDTIVDTIKDLIRYGTFTGGDLGLHDRTIIDESVANQICNIYDALDFTNEDTATIETNKELLRTILGLE